MYTATKKIAAKTERNGIIKKDVLWSNILVLKVEAVDMNVEY